jgi:dihydroorotate dehydrogenase (fumarate)
MKYAEKIQKAGADALELNVFFLPYDPSVKAEDIEKRYFGIVRTVKEYTSIPVALKLGSHFTALARLYRDVSRTVDGLVLFNRFFNPDIDIDKKEITSAGVLSSPAEIAQALRWVGILSPLVTCDLALSSGVHDGAAAVKALLAGAQVVYVASALYEKGTGVMGEMAAFLESWMDRNGYADIKEFRGLLNRKSLGNSDIYERSQFMKYYSSHEG